MYDVEKDAARYMYAKLDYGKGSGTNRKLMKAELDRKFQDEGYKRAFESALMNVDTDRILKSIERKKSMEKAYNGVKTTARTAYRATNMVSRNRTLVDIITRFLKDILGGGR